MARDGVEVGERLAAVVVIRVGADDAQEHFLRKVLGILLGAHVTQTVVEHVVVMSRREPFRRRCLAAGCGSRVAPVPVVGTGLRLGAVMQRVRGAVLFGRGAV